MAACPAPERGANRAACRPDIFASAAKSSHGIVRDARIARVAGLPIAGARAFSATARRAWSGRRAIRTIRYGRYRAEPSSPCLAGHNPAGTGHRRRRSNAPDGRTSAHDCRDCRAGRDARRG